MQTAGAEDQTTALPISGWPLYHLSHSHCVKPTSQLCITGALKPDVPLLDLKGCTGPSVGKCDAEGCDKPTSDELHEDRLQIKSWDRQCSADFMNTAAASTRQQLSWSLFFQFNFLLFLINIIVISIFTATFLKWKYPNWSPFLKNNEISTQLVCQCLSHISALFLY